MAGCLNRSGVDRRIPVSLPLIASAGANVPGPAVCFRAFAAMPLETWQSPPHLHRPGRYRSLQAYWNIGAEGQLFAGAMAASGSARVCDLAPAALLPVIVGA
jgi:hypothetical protein